MVFGQRHLGQLENSLAVLCARDTVSGDATVVTGPIAYFNLLAADTPVLELLARSQLQETTETVFS